jgi:hypothetical protein
MKNEQEHKDILRDVYESGGGVFPDLESDKFEDQVYDYGKWLEAGAMTAVLSRVQELNAALHSATWGDV